MKFNRTLFATIFICLQLLIASAIAAADSALPEVGKPAPDFTLKNDEGKDVSLSSPKIPAPIRHDGAAAGAVISLAVP
ncbi:MAG: hypothetical protein ACREA2_06285 [Blastocatellia bacterium]